jgi:hypothetical protein
LAVLFVVVLVVVLLCRRHRRHPTAPPPPPPSVGEKDDACYTNADSSPNVGMVLPSPTRGGATAMRVAGKGDKEGDYDGDEGGE